MSTNSVQQGYDSPLVISHNLGTHDFGAGAAALAVAAPLGATSCRVVDCHVAATETFTDDTTSALVRVGTAGDPDKFAEFDLLTTAATDGFSGSATDIKAAGKFIDLPRDGDSGAALTQLEVNFVAPTGGTPAGIGEVTLVLAWF